MQELQYCKDKTLIPSDLYMLNKPDPDATPSLSLGSVVRAIIPHLQAQTECKTLCQRHTLPRPKPVPQLRKPFSLKIILCPNSKRIKNKRMLKQDFLGSLVVKTSSSSAGGVGSIPGGGARVPLASWPKKKKPKHKT